MFEGYFSAASLMAMLGWLILIFLPRRWAYLNAVPALVLPVLLSLGYGLLMALYFSSAEGGFDSLASVQALSTTPALALAGWVHYLAFDLFVGAWIAREADSLGISRWLQAPILLLTFMFGPVGWLVFVGVKYPLRAKLMRN